MILSEIIEKKIIILSLFLFSHKVLPKGTNPSKVRRIRMRRWRARVKLMFLTGFDDAHPEPMTKRERKEKFIEYIKNGGKEIFSNLCFHFIKKDVKVLANAEVQFLNKDVTEIIRKLCCMKDY